MTVEKKIIRELEAKMLLKEYIKNKLKDAGYCNAIIHRTALGTRITITALRPGFIIGQSGKAIKQLTTEIQEKFGIENPLIDIQGIECPELNPLVMAQKAAHLIEAGWHFRRVGHTTLQNIMKAGARGGQVIISGKLTGDKHKTVKFSAGNIKHSGEPSNQFVSIAYATALRPIGMYGIKVKIMVPESKLPTEITIKQDEKKRT